MTYKIFTIKSEFGFRTFKFKQPRTGADQKKLGSDFQVRNSVIIRVDSFAFFFSFSADGRYSSLFTTWMLGFANFWLHGQWSPIFR